MKKATLDKFIRAGLAIAKLSNNARAAFLWQLKDGEYTVATNYVFIRFHDPELFKLIESKVEPKDLFPSDTVHQMVEDMLMARNTMELQDSGILTQEPKGQFIRFLIGKEVPVAINDAYLDIFSGDYHTMRCASHTSPVLLLGDDYSAGILPIRTSHKDARFQRMAQLLQLYGIR